MSTNSTVTPSNTLVLATASGYMVFSALGIVSSFTTILVVALSKSLHTPCFVLIAGGAVGSLTVAAHYLGRSINKIRLYLGLIGTARTGLECLLMDGVIGIWALSFHSQVPFLVAIDRLMSVVMPMRYRNVGKKYVIFMLAIFATLSIAQEVVGFATTTLYSRFSVCVEFTQGVSPEFLKAYSGLNLFYCTFTVITYVVMLISFYFNQISLKSQSPTDSFMKQQLAIIPAIKMMTLLYFLTGILAEGFCNVGLSLPRNELASVLISTGTILKAASASVEGVSLVIRCRKFRRCCRAVFLRQKNKISTASTATKTQIG